MIIPQDQLDGWRATLEHVRRALFVTHAHIREGRPREAMDLCMETADSVALTGIRLEQAGAQRPDSLPPPPAVPLALLDTPANRRYAAKLREAWEAGLEVDRERYGDKIGTDGCAQTIEMVLADVEMEIFGPAESRERPADR